MPANLTDEQMREIARGNIEAHLGDVADGDSSADAVFDEAFTLAMDALKDAGVSRDRAYRIAQSLAMDYANP